MKITSSLYPLGTQKVLEAFRQSEFFFIYLGFYFAFNTVQVISLRVVGRAEETSTYSWSRFCSVNCQPMASNYQLSHLRLGREPNPGLRGGRRECYHSATMTPGIPKSIHEQLIQNTEINNSRSFLKRTLQSHTTLFFIKDILAECPFR